MQEQKIGSADDLKERADAALSRYHKLGDSIKAAEKRMAEIAVLRAHIVNYAKTRPVYDAYRKSGYSSKFWKRTGKKSRCIRRRKPLSMNPA